MKTLEHKNFKTLRIKNTRTNRSCFHVFMFPCFHDQKGMAALLTIVVVAAASLIMAYTASILSLGELEMGYNSQKSSESLSLADGCLEESLRRLKLDAGYSGGALNLGDGSCIITVAPGDGDATVTIGSTLDKYHKKIQVVVGIVGSDITIESYEELSL